MLTSGHAQNKPIQIHIWAIIKKPATQSGIIIVFNRQKWMQHTHTHITHRLSYKWSCARPGHSLYTISWRWWIKVLSHSDLPVPLLPPSSISWSQWRVTILNVALQLQQLPHPKLRGLFLASMELHVHVEKTGVWEGRGSTSKCSRVAKTHRLTSCQG